MAGVPLTSVNRAVVAVTRSWEQGGLITLFSGAQLSHCVIGREHSYLAWDAKCWWVAQNAVVAKVSLFPLADPVQRAPDAVQLSSSASPQRNAGLDHTHCQHRTSALNFMPQTSASWTPRWPLCSCTGPHTVAVLCWRWQAWSWHWVCEHLSSAKSNRWGVIHW